MKLLFLIFSLCSFIACSPAPGAETALKNSADATYKNIVYRTTLNGNGDSIELMADIYLPASNFNTLCPYIVFAHAGGFVGGDKVNEKVDDFAPFYNANGFGFMSINYRLMKKTDNKKQLEIYRAVQDFIYSVKFLKSNFQKYSVDTNNVFLMGCSSGAIMTIYGGYWDNSDITGIDTKKEGLLPATEIRGLISCWGGVTDISIFTGKYVPVYFFHTTGDKTIPCGKVNGNYGSCALYPILTGLKIPCELFTWDKNSHGVGLIGQQDIKDKTLPWLNNLLQ